MSSSLTEVADKPTVKISKTQEQLQRLVGVRDWPFRNREKAAGKLELGGR